MGTDHLNHSLFTALLAHDISNFNQTTRGYLEMLLDEQMGPLAEDQRRALTTCLRQCHRVRNVVDAVRLLEDLADTELVVEARDLDAAIREAITTVQNRHGDRDIRVRFSVGGRKALAEPMLSTVFTHLIDNAARHNDCEVVEVDIEIQQTGTDRPMWEVTVSDNGNGVPPIKRDVLFTRLDSGEIHGAGISLAVVKTLLDRWGGWVRLDDTPPGQGASFTLGIPSV